MNTQVREAKASKDLLIDQLRELFLELGHAKVNTKKSLDQLDLLKVKWEEVKKVAPLKKDSVAPVKDGQARRIKNEIQQFTDDVNKYARDFRKLSFLVYSTGPEASYTAIDKEVCSKPYL